MGLNTYDRKKTNNDKEIALYTTIFLQSFVGSDRKIWVYDSLNKRFFPCNPRDIGCENNLYETHWENANPLLGEFILQNQIENKFAEYEGKYSKLVRKIIEICDNVQKQNEQVCVKEEQEILASLVSNIMLRNPWFMRQAKLDCITDGIMDVKEIKDIDVLMHLMGLGGTESLVKYANKMVWLDENFNGSVQQKAKNE